MFLKFESARKNEKEESVPLTRNNSLYNQTPRGDNKHPPNRIIHTPPLIVKIADNMSQLRIPVDRDESDIALLHRSPFQRRAGGVSTRSTARDTTDGGAPYKVKKSGKNKGDEELLQNKRTNIEMHYRRQSYKSPAPMDEARKLAKLKKQQKAEEGNEGANLGEDGARVQSESRPTSMGMLDSDANSSDGETTTRQKKAYLKSKELITYFAQLARSKNTNDTIDLKKVDRLLKNGADINVNDKYGQTVLHEVAKNWHTDIAKYLIKKGASFTVQDRYGRTPLHLASAVGHVEMIDFLVGKDTGIFKYIISGIVACLRRQIIRKI